MFQFVFILLLCLLPPLIHAQAQVQDQTCGKGPRPNLAMNETKKFYFNKQGVLTVDGTVQGTSDPIMFERRNYNNYCARRPYYVFTFCPKDRANTKKLKKVCNDGIIFCYDGQLSEEYSQRSFALPSLDTEIMAKCKDFHGFKVAMRYLKKTTDYHRNDYMFLEVKTSYMKESYFFPLPHSKCMDLFMGNSNNLLTAVRSAEGDYEMVQPREVVLDDGTKAGIHYSTEEIGGAKKEEVYRKFKESFGKLPSVENYETFAQAPHLNMLYLDFKSRFPSPQMMFTIAPESDCNMVARVTSNTVSSCKATFTQKNYALRSFGHGNSTTEYALTLESGIEESTTSGSRRSSSRGETAGSESGGSETDEDFRRSGMQNEEEHVSRTEDISTHEKSHEKSWGAQAKAGIDGSKGDLKGELSVEGSYDQSTGHSEKMTNFNIKTNHQSKSNTEATSTTDILENAYRNMETTTNTQKANSFNSQTVGVSRRTVFKWIVKVPPKMVLTPMQMQMDCDGAQVKIPWIKFVLTKEGQDEDMPLVEYD